MNGAVRLLWHEKIICVLVLWVMITLLWWLVGNMATRVTLLDVIHFQWKFITSLRLW